MKKDEDEIVKETRYPQQGEVIGLVTKALGAALFSVHCNDGKDRLCLIPGKYKRKFWIKERDYVLIKINSVEPDKKGEIIHRYSVADIEKLKAKHLIDNL
ncbi:MAG: translation initiation factor 1A [Candidatus Micrarchaeota archaeon]|nr:MAG: translation initiation factor 1A [Candidatus Micrarchaeota archaeon]